ncbi:MAG: GTPase Era [Victivallales bacterium]|nr:GTPase Era [Victivallales bacterium]
MNEITEKLPPKGRTGYVALLGRPNTGKSTFLNTVLGCHIAAVSNKPQTTRKSMLGIYNDADSQVVFLDAPGVHSNHLAIDEAMSESVLRTLGDADIVLCLVDPTRVPGDEDGMAAKLAAESGKPVLLVLNKCDVSTQAQRDSSLAFYREFLPETEVLLLTATRPASCNSLMEKVKSMLPEDLFLYERDAVTTAYERDIAAELIRESLLEKLQDELPHCIAVTIDTWKSSEEEIQIRATLNLEREAHKGMVIGQGGRMLKAIRKDATARISELCGGVHVILSLFVKVVPNWRKHKQFLKEIKLWE